MKIYYTLRAKVLISVDSLAELLLTVSPFGYRYQNGVLHIDFIDDLNSLQAVTSVLIAYDVLSMNTVKNKV